MELAIGESIKRLRNNARMTQDDLAAVAGVSTDVIRKLEQGRRHTASIRTLHGIAAALDVDLGELLGRESMPDAAPDAGVVALRQAVADIADLLEDVDGEPLSLRDAERSVTYLWGVYWSGKWDQLTGLIPQALTGLQATLHAADATTRPQAAEQLAWCYSVAAATLTHLGQPDAGFMAARRALDFAAGGDDALLAADFLESSRDIAQRVAADRMDYEISFGPSLVTMQTVDVCVVSEDYPAALDAASRMPTNPGLPLLPAAGTWPTGPAPTRTWAGRSSPSRCC